MIRYILNHLGEKLGELEEPAGVTWSEEEWSIKLAEYATPPSPTLIPDVSPRQFRTALVLSGISMASVEAAIDQLPDPDKTIAHIGWEYALAFERNNELVSNIGALLNLNSQQLDDLWLLAGTL
jgi:hypothetical protein